MAGLLKDLNCKMADNKLQHRAASFFTAQCDASALYAVVVCLSVCHKSVFY